MNEIVKKTEEILQNEYGCALKTATTKELYNALSKAAMQSIATAWQKTKNDTGKRCGYLSAEFLVGRSVFANLQSLGALEEVRTVLKERGVDINRNFNTDDWEDVATACAIATACSAKPLKTVFKRKKGTTG